MIMRKKVEDNSEFLVLSYMIMNTSVLFSGYSRYKSGQLKTKHFTKYFQPIFRWLIRYHAQHHKAPGRTIQKVFEEKKKNLSKGDCEIIDDYLDRLAEEFILYQEDSVDPAYIRNEVLLDFIRKREISERILKAQDKIDKGQYEEAEKIVSTYPVLNKNEEDETLGTIIPYSSEDLVNHDESHSAADVAFQFDGDLHHMVGSLNRTWLVAITGTEKTGKSYFLQEMAFQAALYQRKKVLIINLELGESIVRNRTRRRLTLTTNKKRSQKVIYPVFDCENNQNGTCRILSTLKNKKGLFKDSTEVVDFMNREGWKVCTQCRNDPNIRRNAASSKRFIPTIWFDKTRIMPISNGRVAKAINRNRMTGLSNLRVKCFPRFSVTFDEVYDYVRRYVDRTGWVPDIIVFDYLDILAPEAGNLQERIDVDRKWKKAARMAGEMNCLVLTADQATKTSRTQYALDQMSTSESKTKDSHLDVRLAINQTDDEKELNITRMNVLFHRHIMFSVKHEVLITQRLVTAEPMVDNSRLFFRGKKYRLSGTSF